MGDIAIATIVFMATEVTDPPIETSPITEQLGTYQGTEQSVVP